MTTESFIDVMGRIPDAALRERVRAFRETATFEQNEEGIGQLRRGMAKLLHPDIAKCEVAALALSLFNAKLDRFAHNLAKGYHLDTSTNRWVKSAS